MVAKSTVSERNFPLGIDGFNYADLHQPERLHDLFTTFETFVKEDDITLYEAFHAYRASKGEGMSPIAISDLLVRMAPYVGRFVGTLFTVTETTIAQRETIREEFNTIFVYRTEVVGKLRSTFKNVDVKSWDSAQIKAGVACLKAVAFPIAAADPDPERAMSRVAATLVRLIERCQKDNPADADREVAALRQRLNADAHASAVFRETLALPSTLEFIDALLDRVRRWSYLARHDDELMQLTANWMSFKQPEKTDVHHLVKHDVKSHEGFCTWVAPAPDYRRRDGFALTDPRFNERQILYEVDHCIYCHERDTDSCSKGMRNKKTGKFKHSEFGEAITGCPLDEKISEMHWLKRQGDNIGALALIIIDNPMCPGTGHRICNECMKACIYQKTEPVDIPQIETNVLTDVLFMPWGFEIYSLLTRWNPLNVKRPYAMPYNGKNVLVVGLGPAGYTLSHYLINEGVCVVGIDALKIEPLPDTLSGADGELPAAVKDFSALYERLDERPLSGFGGVAEYGITARWDKNFLKVIYLNLVRRQTFRCYGGVRFGGTITLEEAWDMGFDHVAIAGGAGKPTIIDIKNNLIRGIRKASDFLMSLQLTGAAKASSLANLQVRLPAGIIGGGLTALDTTTEVMAYYPVQVEKILHRYETLVKGKGEASLRERYDEEELLVLDEFLQHGRAVREERKRAAAAKESPNFRPLIEKWGGVILFYRKGIQDSPAYKQNHEEIRAALQEGIQLAEGLSPEAAIADEYGALKAVIFKKLNEERGAWTDTGKTVEQPLRSLFIAAGTAPNTIYEQEYPGTFKMDGHFFQRYEPRWNEKSDIPELVAVDDAPFPKIGKPAPLTSYCKNGKFVSFYGDNHPVYAGNVVRAMASAKDGYAYIIKLFKHDLAARDANDQDLGVQRMRTLFKRLDTELLATVVAVNRLSPTIVEVLAKAPMQARKFQPGQFYRVQNFENTAHRIKDTVLLSESLALTGAWVDKDQGIISLITLEMGSSSKLCALWRPGDPLVVMGVTGKPTSIGSGKTVMLVGGGLGNAVLFSIGKALRAAGNTVIYFAGYRKLDDVFKIEDIEAASDIIVWAVDPLPDAQAVTPSRPQDLTCVGNILEAIESYAKGTLGETPVKLADVDHMIVIGSDTMMEAVKNARFNHLKPYLKEGHTAIGSINSPMQCMMKGICAQCLCKQSDPNTGEESFVYSCYSQDQELDKVDFPNLHARLRQNSVQEKLSDLWLEYLLDFTNLTIKQDKTS